jgi:hypothetical protein
VALVAALVAGAGAFVLLRVADEPQRAQPSLEPLRLRTRDFTRDPGWQGRNNRRLGRCVTTRQDFGAGPGSAISGLLTRNARAAWFGRTVAYDFERPFVATGQLVVRGTQPEPFPSGSVLIGLFNHANRDWRPPDLLAFQVNADTVEGGGDYSLSLAYGAHDFQQDHVAYGGDESPSGLRFGRAYRWRLSYDPQASGGVGRATLSIPQAGPPATLALSPGARRAGAVLDRFGVANQTMARGEGLDFELRDLTIDGVTQRTGGPGWQGMGNRASFRDCLTDQPNDFGWTGPVDGRVGGLIARTDEDRPDVRAFYADRVGRLSLRDRLHAAGTVRLSRANSDSATLLGWFRAGTTGKGSGNSAPPDFLGVAITGPSAIGQYFGPLVADGSGEVASEDEAGIVFNPGPRTLRWSVDYHPRGQGRGGDSGRIFIRLGDQRRLFKLPKDLAREGATFNRFGLRNLERGGSFQVVHLDQLRYSIAGPEEENRAKRGPE